VVHAGWRYEFWWKFFQILSNGGTTEQRRQRNKLLSQFSGRGHYCFLVLVITWYASAVGECRADQLGPRWTLDTQISSIRMQKRDSGLRNNKLSMERNKDDKNDTSNWVNAH